MTAAEKRLKNLETLMEDEMTSPEPSKNYIEDLKLSIKQCKLDIKNSSREGYRMVG